MPFAAVDEAAGREVRAGDEREQFGLLHVRLLDEGDGRVHDLREVVRRNLRRHADGDAFGAVEQKVRHARRHDRRLAQRLVVVGVEGDGLLLDVGENLAGDLRHARFGVAHRGGRVAVHRAEVALPVDQRVAHREVLRQADDGVVDGRVAVRVVLTDHVADDARRLLVSLVVLVAEFVHRPEHAPVDGLEPVAHVRQRAPDDDRHGVVEIRTAHLVFDVDVVTFKSFHLINLSGTICRALVRRALLLLK